MKAILLAAGRGSRLKNLTDDIPKCLNVVAGKTILKWIIDSLETAGVEEVTIVGGYRADQLAFFKKPVIENKEWADTNMVWSLFKARHLFHEPHIVSYTDILYSPEAVRKLIEDRSRCEVAMIYDTDFAELWKKRFHDPLLDAENFRISENGYVQEIGGRLTDFDNAQGQYTGLLKIYPGFFLKAETALTETELKTMDMTTLLSILIDKGCMVKGVPMNGRWMEVDTQTDLELGNRLIESGYLRL